MIPYQSRIVNTPEYLQALGQVHYNFGVATWGVVYLVQTLSRDYTRIASQKDASVIARDFLVVARTNNQDRRYEDLAGRYSAIVETRATLLPATGITATDGSQVLDGLQAGTDYQWTMERLYVFAKEIENLDIDAVDLYYSLHKADTGTSTAKPT